MEKKVVKMEEDDSVLYKIDKTKFNELKEQMETEWEGHKIKQSTTTERGIEVRTILMMLDWVKDNNK
jgi:phage pi2 protein 07